MALIQPKIDFAMTLLPYTPNVLKTLETMQYKSIRILFGFQPNTKRESMLVMCGIPSVRQRMTILKFRFANKVLNMNNGFYVKEISLANWTHSSGIGADLRAILKEWDNKEVLEICEPISEQVSCAQALLNDPLDLTMSKVDFEYCRNELKKSLNSTGQTSNILRAIEGREAHSLIPHLQVYTRRSQLTLFSNVLSGCDFLTPFNYSKKPKCKFCDCEKADWIHLLFACKQFENNNFMANYLKDIKSGIAENRYTKLLETLESFWELKKHSDLFQLILATDLEKHELNFFDVICVLVRATSKRLQAVEQDWMFVKDE